MAYMTTHNMNISESVPTITMVATQIAGMEDPQIWGPGTSEDAKVSFWEGVLNGENDTTWYEHERDMRRVSNQWPGVTFTLTGQGDDHEDEWIEHHRSGKMQRVKRDPWEPPEMDESQLA